MVQKRIKQVEALDPTHQQFVRAYELLILTLIEERNRGLQLAKRIRERHGAEAAREWLAQQSGYIRDQATR